MFCGAIGTCPGSIGICGDTAGGIAGCGDTRPPNPKRCGAICGGIWIGMRAGGIPGCGMPGCGAAGPGGIA
jgi:hypothetical protein